MPSRGRAGGRVSLLAALGGAFGINTGELVGKHRDPRPKPREIRLRGPGRDYGYDESDEDSDYDDARPVYLGRPGRRSHGYRRMHNSSSRVSDDAMVSDSSSLLTLSSGSNEPAGSNISTGRSSREIDGTRHKSSSVSSGPRSSSRLPPSGRYRLSSSDLPQSSHAYNASTEQVASSRAPMPTNDFLKTVAELEEDYNQRAAATRKAKHQAASSRTDDKPARRVLGETTNSGNLQAGDIPSQSEHGENGKVSDTKKAASLTSLLNGHFCSGCGIGRAASHNFDRLTRKGKAPWKNLCGECLELHFAGDKYPAAEYGHLCSGCGFARSTQFHEQHPIRVGDGPVPNICRICREKRNSKAQNPTETLLGTDNMEVPEVSSVGSASPRGFTDRRPLAANDQARPASRQERRRQQRHATRPVEHTAQASDNLAAPYKPSPSTPHRRPVHTHYRRPTVEDASNASDAILQGNDSDIGSGLDFSSPIKPRKVTSARHLSIPSPLVDQSKQGSKKHTSRSYAREAPGDLSWGPRQPIVRDSDSPAAGISSSRPISFNERLHGRTSDLRDELGRHHHDQAPGSDKLSSGKDAHFDDAHGRPFLSERPSRSWTSSSKKGVASGPGHNFNNGLDPDHLRRQMYEAGGSPLAHQYLPKTSTSAPINPRHADHLHFGGYSELAQEYLNPSAFRKRQEERAHAQSEARDHSGGAQNRPWRSDPSAHETYRYDRRHSHEEASHLKVDDPWKKYAEQTPHFDASSLNTPQRRRPSSAHASGSRSATGNNSHSQSHTGWGGAISDVTWGSCREPKLPETGRIVGEILDDDVAESS